MKIGMFSQVFNSSLANGEIEAIDTCIEELKKLGISCVTVNSGLLQTIASEKIIMSEIISKGLPVQCCYFRESIECLDSLNMIRLIENLKVKTEQCSRLHSKQLMPIIYYTEKKELSTTQELNWLAEYLNRASEITAEYDIKTSIENNAFQTVLLRSASDVDYILSNVKNIGYIMDTGNFWFTDEENVSKEIIEKYSDRITGVHVKDILPGEKAEYLIYGKRGETTLIGTGVIRVAAILNQLISRGCDLNLTIEINGHSNGIEKIRKALLYLHKNIIHYEDVGK